MGSIRVAAAAVVAVALGMFGCAVSGDLDTSSPSAPRARDGGTADSSGFSPSPPGEGTADPPSEPPPTTTEPDTGSEPEDTEPPAFPGSEDAEPPPSSMTCEDCLTNCDGVCAMTPASCKACDDACFAGPCSGGSGPDAGPDPCGCVDACESYCYYSFDPYACEGACIATCTAECK